MSANNNTVHRTIVFDALALLGEGFRPVVINPPGFAIKQENRPDKIATGKEPFGKAWGIKEVTKKTLTDDASYFTTKGYKPNIGLCLGPGRSPGGAWLVDVEGDGPEAEASRLLLLGGELIETRGWASARGRHDIFRADGARMTALSEALKPFQVKTANQPGVFHLPALPDLELRIGGWKSPDVVKQLQSVCPPSIGTDGKPREWGPCRTLADLPEAFFVNLERFIREAKPLAPTEQPKPKGTIAKAKASSPQDAYLKATLAGAVGRIEAAGEGQRRDTYRDEAFALAGWLHLGFGYTESELASTLKSALAIGVNHGDPVVGATVDEAIQAGKLKPRPLDIESTRRNGSTYAKGSNGNGAGQHEHANGKKAERNGNGKPPGSPHSAMTGLPQRPEIEITTERHHVVSQVVKALSKDPDLYWRGEDIAIVVEEPDPNARLLGGVELRNAMGSPKVITLAESGVGCYMTKNATFYVWVQGKGGESAAKDCHPPTWLIRAVAELKHYPGMKWLAGIAESPFIRADGSIVTSPGYDPFTGVLYKPSIGYPEIPKRPTQNDAEDAAKRILAVVSQIPFGKDEDKAVFLAGVLAQPARAAIAGPVPGIAFIGNKAGVGKGLGIDVIGMISTGRNIPTSAYPSDPIEANKVKVAIALAGKPFVHFDNLEEGSSYGNSALDSALTSDEVDDRILGTSKNTGRLPWRAVVFLSGNNLTPGKDAFRRWLPCNLVSSLETPEERDDLEIEDLRAYARDRRGELMRDALTILKAHADAGYPKGKWAPLGSFGAWDRVIRGAVWFATGLDCCETRKEAAQEAPDRAEKLALLEAWRLLPNGRGDAEGITVEKAIQLAMLPENPYPEVRQVLMRRSRDGKIPDPRKVGNFIRGLKDAVYNGMKFEKGGEERRSAKWRVSGRPISKCESDESGESDSNPTQTRMSTESDTVTSESRSVAYQGGLKSDSPDSSDSHRREDDGIDWTRV